jgi:hypothetical protein
VRQQAIGESNTLHFFSCITRKIEPHGVLPQRNHLLTKFPESTLLLTTL